MNYKSVVLVVEGFDADVEPQSCTQGRDIHQADRLFNHTKLIKKQNIN
jgi:hypothetical protein